MFHYTIMKRLRIEGFVILDHAAEMPRIHAQLSRWLQEEKLKFRLNISSGIEQAPQALVKLYEGSNDGKVLLKLGDPD